MKQYILIEIYFYKKILKEMSKIFKHFISTGSSLLKSTRLLNSSRMFNLNSGQMKVSQEEVILILFFWRIKD